MSERSSMDARFWLALGVEVFAGLRVSYPPPRVYRFAIREPIDFTLDEDAYMPAAVPEIQTVDFRLAQWSRSGGVAHYELDSMPRDGWRWLAVNGAIHAERIS